MSQSPKMQYKFEGLLNNKNQKYTLKNNIVTNSIEVIIGRKGYKSVLHSGRIINIYDNSFNNNNISNNHYNNDNTENVNITILNGQ